MTADLDAFIGAAETHGLRPRRNGTGFKLRCPHPSHPDKNPSATAGEGRDGILLINCMVCAPQGAAHADWYRECLEALGLWQEYVPPEPITIDFSQPKTYAHPKARAKPGVHEFEARWDDGTPVPAVHRREDYASGGKSLTWEPTGVVKLNHLALWRANLLDPDKTYALVVEGERAALSLLATGEAVQVVATYGTAHTPSDAALSALAGRYVTLWPDNDAKGRAHMLALAQRLTGVAKGVSVVAYDDTFEPGWDAGDHTADDGLLATMYSEAEPYEPGESNEDETKPSARRDIGSATANDLPQGAPPDLLLGPWLHPEETTIIYGPGGVGKGVTAAWLTQQLVAAGHTVMVLDYEYHPREWGNRLDGLQMTADEKDHVHYRAPFGPDWAAKTGTLIEVWDLVREDADRLGVTYVVVDSYTPATGDDDRMGGQGAAQQFAQAASRIGRPMLVLAHVASMAGRFPDKPFGSVHVRNLVARRQWAVESNGDTQAAHPLTEPSVIRLEFRNTKGNDYAKAKPRHVTISFWPLGLIEVTDEEDAKPSVEFLIDAVLDRPLSTGDIRKAIREDFRDTEPPTEGVIDMTLRRHPEKYVIDRAAKRPFPWAKVEVAESA